VRPASPGPSTTGNSGFSDTPTPGEDDYADLPADAATTRSIGERLDRHYAISVLTQHRNNRPIGPADKSRPRRRVTAIASTPQAVSLVMPLRLNS